MHSLCNQYPDLAQSSRRYAKTFSRIRLVNFRISPVPQSTWMESSNRPGAANLHSEVGAGCRRRQRRHQPTSWRRVWATPVHPAIANRTAAIDHKRGLVRCGPAEMKCSPPRRYPSRLRRNSVSRLMPSSVTASAVRSHGPVARHCCLSCSKLVGGIGAFPKNGGTACYVCLFCVHA